MAYLVFARKYRPQNFQEIIGQEHIIKLLSGAVTSQRLAHAYLFCGPRGVGKTSCARIFAKSLNCEKGPTLTPCDQCSSCKEITAATSFDVLEVDGASNRGIDEVRTLRENVKFAPAYGRYKIYIIDEVHMLTTEAFNALLKTLEEPPEYVKFIFATTAPQKLPATIISRCQRFDFKRISLQTTVDVLEAISKKEKLRIDKDALYAIAKAAQGSMRDALSILDQLGALKDQDIQSEDVCMMLGLVELSQLFELNAALAVQDPVTALKLIDQFLDQGKDARQLVNDCLEHFRNLMIVKIGGKALGRLIDYPVSVKELYLQQAQQLSLKQILQTLEAFIEVQEQTRATGSIRIPLEIAVAKLTYQEEKVKEQVVKQNKDKVLPETLAQPRAPVLNNEKGAVKLFRDESDALPDSDKLPRADIAPEETEGNIIDIKHIQRAWDALTYAVSRQKMSLATFLQDGIPTAFSQDTLVVGFAPNRKFQKESLEDKNNQRLVEQVLSEHLKKNIKLKYVLMDKDKEISQSEGPVVRNALDTFGGTVVSRWHNEGKG